MTLTFKHDSTTRKLKAELVTPEKLAKLFNLKLSTLNLGDDEGNAYEVVNGRFEPPLPESGEFGIYGEKGVDGAEKDVVHVDARVSASKPATVRPARNIGRIVELALDSTKTLRESTGYLVCAPEACLLVEQLTVLAACTSDPSLVNSKTKTNMESMDLLKTPHSFRASLYQITSSICDSFRVANRSMGAISASLHNLPLRIENILEAMAEDDVGTAHCVKLNLDQIEKACATCKEEATKPTDAFEKTLKEINQLVQAGLATQTHTAEEKERVAREREKYEAEKKFHAQEAAELAGYAESQMKIVEEARNEYKEQKEKSGNMGNLFAAMFMDTLSSAVRTVSSGLKVANRLGDPTIILKETVMRRTCTEMMGGLASSTETLLAQRDELELNLNSATNFNPNTDYGKNVKKQANIVRNALAKLNNRTPDARNMYDQACQDLRSALRVAEEAEQKYDVQQQKQPPSTGSRPPSMLDALQNNTRESGKHYESERGKLDQTRERLSEARRKLSELVVKIAHAQTDEANLADVLKYLQQGVAVLVEVRFAWIQIAEFFSKVEIAVKSSLVSSITMFTATASQGKSLIGNSTKRLILNSALDACGKCTQVYNCAALYQEISQAFVIPVIAGVGRNLLLTKAEAKSKLEKLEKFDTNQRAKVEEMIKSRIKAMGEASEKLLAEYSEDMQKSIGL